MQVNINKFCTDIHLNGGDGKARTEILKRDHPWSRLRMWCPYKRIVKIHLSCVRIKRGGSIIHTQSTLRCLATWLPEKMWKEEVAIYEKFTANQRIGFENFGFEILKIDSDCHTLCMYGWVREIFICLVCTACGNELVSLIQRRFEGFINSEYDKHHWQHDWCPVVGGGWHI